MPRLATPMMEFGPLSETGDGRDVGGWPWAWSSTSVRWQVAAAWPESKGHSKAHPSDCEGQLVEHPQVQVLSRSGAGELPQLPRSGCFCLLVPIKAPAISMEGRGGWRKEADGVWR